MTDTTKNPIITGTTATANNVKATSTIDGNTIHNLYENVLVCPVGKTSVINNEGKKLCEVTITCPVGQVAVVDAAGKQLCETIMVCPVNQKPSPDNKVCIKA